MNIKIIDVRRLRRLSRQAMSLSHRLSAALLLVLMILVHGRRMTNLH